MIRAATRERIESNLRHDPVYRGYLADHLPMVLVALEGLGADDAAIAAYAQRHSLHLERFRADPVRDALAAAFERDGVETVLRDTMDRLLAGVSAGAFHGAIRTAYALESGSPGELAHALAYWTASAQELGAMPAAAGSLSPFEALDRLSTDPAFAGRRPHGRNIAERTAAAARDPGLAAHVGSVDAAQLDLDSLAAAAVRLYARGGDFTVLHMVTGTHAARALVPYANDPDAAVSHLWHALVAAYAGAGCPRASGWDAGGKESWDDVRAAAVACDDEHDVKLAYTCWREWQRTGDELYRRAAAARVRHAREEAKA